ncbi:MAG: ABC transporter ATP-binding protein [Thermoleophilaceae bacterium]|nr:ABC transporter ATP-binding protein [Thermoleophilaceae bacterium]
MLRFDSVTKRFGPTVALDDASLEVAAGEVVALLGPSGCGKTTALRVAAGFERPDGGRVEVDGRVVAGPGVYVAPERRAVGMVFQDYALFPHLDVASNIAFGLPRRERGSRVDELLELVGLTGLGSRSPGTLSGGQQQRVALARALAPRPGLVLLDEPWSAIDALLRAEMRGELARVLRAEGVTVVLVTHDREEAFTLADRIALMRDGEVLQCGRPEDLYFTPADRWCARFVGASNLVPAQLASGFEGGERVGASGEVLVRPELVGLEIDPGGAAEVVGRTFLGHDVLYRVRLADGTLLAAQRPSNEEVPLGSRVRVRLHEGRVTSFDRP